LISFGILVNFLFVSLRIHFPLGLNGYTFVDLGSGTGSLCPLVLKAGLLRYVGVEYDCPTAADSIEAITRTMETDKEGKLCLKHISIVLGNILKLTRISGGGQGVVIHSYLMTMDSSFALNVHIIGLISRSDCVVTWIFHDRWSIDKGGVLQLLTMMFDNGEETEGEQLDKLFKNLKKKYLPDLVRCEMPGIAGDGSDIEDDGISEDEYVYYLPVTVEVRLKMLNHLDQLHKGLRGLVRQSVETQRQGARVSATAAIFDCDNLPTIHERQKRWINIKHLENELKKEADSCEWL
jgi:hypothetical protein